MPKLKASSRSILAAGVMLLGAAVTACSDATAPDAVEPQRSGYLTTSAAVLKSGTIDFKVKYPKLSVQIPSVTMKGDTTIQKFTVNPLSGKRIEFGKNSGNVIAIPANTLCDPSTSTYGPTEWMKPCVLATSSISFEVRTWNDAQGRPHADFSPDIRFSPTAPQPVALYFQDPALTNYSSVYIPYCNALNVCVKEEATDAFLTTNVTPLSGGGYWVYRNLRHFSGYNVTAF